MGRLCIVSVLVYLLVKGEGNVELYAIDLIYNLVKDVLKQCYVGDRRGGECTLNLEYKAETWKTHCKEGVTIVVLHWWDYGGIGDGLATDSGGPQLECVWGVGAPW